MHRSRWLAIAGAVFCWLLLAVRATAATITFGATDLPDTGPGQDLWQYAYRVAGGTFQQFESFNILFPPGQYAEFETSPAAPNADWLVLTVPIDSSLQADGVYSATGLIDNPSLADPFLVQFVWLGNGTPGAQAFDVLDADFNVIQSALTVPEPSSLALLGAGLAVFGLRRRLMK